MIWTLASRLSPPRFWLRVTVDFFLVVAVAYVLYLSLFDTMPPYEPGSVRGKVGASQIARGGFQEIQWDLVQQRRCAEVHIRRALFSAAQPGWTVPLADAMPGDWDDAALPLAQRVMSQPILIPPSMPLGKAIYRVEVIAACNWLQSALPESMWIHQRFPGLGFSVVLQ